MDFIINSTMFLNPHMRKMQQPDFSALVHRYSRDEGPITFSLKMQFNVFKNDSTVDVQFNLQNEDTVKFWCLLFDEDEYKQLSGSAFIIHCSNFSHL